MPKIRRVLLLVVVLAVASVSFGTSSAQAFTIQDLIAGWPPVQYQPDVNTHRTGNAYVGGAGTVIHSTCVHTLDGNGGFALNYNPNYHAETGGRESWGFFDSLYYYHAGLNDTIHLVMFFRVTYDAGNQITGTDWHPHWVLGAEMVSLSTHLNPARGPEANCGRIA